MIGTTLSHYRIVEQIGAGGMGVVYRAHDERLDRDVAIKVLPTDIAAEPDRLARFEREAKAVAKLDHPNILAIHQLGTHEGAPFIVTELLEGHSLRKVVVSGELTLNKALEYGGQVATGLAAAHDKGITHRDLKPENLFLTRHGLIKILDFGLAKLARREFQGETDTEGTTLTGGTVPGKVMGTVGYMSPEQMRGQAVDHRSDIFALGVVLYELISGERPFRGNTAADTAAAILKEDPTPLQTVLPGTPKPVEVVIHRCLEKRSDDRFQSARDLGFALQSAAEGRSDGALAAAPEPVAHPSLPPFLEGEVKEIERPVFVAREAELTRLNVFLESAISGKGSVAFVTGDAGTGKTALIGEFMRRAVEAHEDLVVAGGGCSAQTGEGDPYAPFRQVLALLTGDVEAKVESGALNREQGKRLWKMAPVGAEAVVESGPDLVDTLIPGAGLLTRAEASAEEEAAWLRPLRELVERKASLPPDASLQQAAVFMQCDRVVQAIAAQQPLLIVLEDLHWSDAGSIALLFHLGREVKGSRVLIVGTFRPAEIGLGRGGEQHPFEPVVAELKGIYGEIIVELGQAADRAFVNALLASEPNLLGKKFHKVFFDQTQGHALFTVELLRTMQDRGMIVQDDEGQWVEDSDLDWHALPARIEGVIAARIERLSENLRDMLIIASVEGEDFTAEVLARVRDADTRETIRLLSRELEKRHRLVSARGIRALADGRISLYGFSHVLFQRYLYNHLDEVERAQLHEDVGTVLEALYGDEIEEISPQLARHFDEAGIVDKAIRYHHQAGERAKRMLANTESMAHLERALELLMTVPESSERDRQEVGLRIALFPPLASTQGYGSALVWNLAERCLVLCQEFGDDALKLPVLWILSTLHVCGRSNLKAVELAQEMLDLAVRLDDPVQTAMAHWILGLYTAATGKLVRGKDHLEEAYSFFDPHQHRALTMIFGLDPGLLCRTHLSWINMILGNLDRAVEMHEEAEALGKTVAHPPSTVFANIWFFLSRWTLEDVERAEKCAEAAVTTARELGIEAFLALAESVHGAVIAAQGAIDPAIAQINEALATLRRGGNTLTETVHLALFAEALRNAGMLDEALANLDEALSLAETRHELVWEAELHRIKGQVLLDTGTTAEAEASFKKALEVARSQNARFWELRAATCLARLWQSQGKRGEAHDLLVPVYEWFTEGLDTPPLQGAKDLLEELEHEVTTTS